MNHIHVTVQKKKTCVTRISNNMPLFKNKEELVEETKKWIEDNRELYEYLVEFEQNKRVHK